ncbi:22307_t:CDS:2, partial [Racocetra persica]
MATNISIVLEKNKNQFTWLQLFANNDLREATNEEFIYDILFYRKVWEKVYIRKDELVRRQETTTHSSLSTTGDIENSSIQLVNLCKVAVKERPKRTSHYNKSTTKTTLQETSNKKQYTCGFCKELGHNVATCSNKIQ